MLIRDINEFAEYLGTTTDRLEHDIYKYTECGAWINWDEKEIRIGSIVEGSDAEFSCAPLVFPFDSAEYDKAIDWLESETDFEWHRVNPTIEDIACFIDVIFANEEKPHDYYTIEDAETDLEEHRKTFDLEFIGPGEEVVDLFVIDAEDYMEAMNYCIQYKWHSLKEGV